MTTPNGLPCPAPYVSLTVWTDAWLEFPAMLRHGADRLAAVEEHRNGLTTLPGEWKAGSLLMATDASRCRIPDSPTEIRSPPSIDRHRDRVCCLLLRTSLEALARAPYLAERFPLGDGLLFRSVEATEFRRDPAVSALEALPKYPGNDLLHEALAYLRDAASRLASPLPNLRSPDRVPQFPSAPGDDTAVNPAANARTRVSDDVGPSLVDLLRVRSLPAGAVEELLQIRGLSHAADLRDKFPDDMPRDWCREMDRWLVRVGFPRQTQLRCLSRSVVGAASS